MPTLKIVIAASLIIVGVVLLRSPALADSSNGLPPVDPETQFLWDHAKLSNNPNTRCIPPTKEHPAPPTPAKNDNSREADLARICPHGYAPIGLHEDHAAPTVPAPPVDSQRLQGGNQKMRYSVPAATSPAQAAAQVNYWYSQRPSGNFLSLENRM